jgi:hypothetical protein
VEGTDKKVTGTDKGQQQSRGSGILRTQHSACCTSWHREVGRVKGRGKGRVKGTAASSSKHGQSDAAYPAFSSLHVLWSEVDRSVKVGKDRQGTAASRGSGMLLQRQGYGRMSRAAREVLPCA